MRWSGHARCHNRCAGRCGDADRQSADTNTPAHGHAHSCPNLDAHSVAVSSSVQHARSYRHSHTDSKAHCYANGDTSEYSDSTGEEERKPAPGAGNRIRDSRQCKSW